MLRRLWNAWLRSIGFILLACALNEGKTYKIGGIEKKLKQAYNYSFKKAELGSDALNWLKHLKFQLFKRSKGALKVFLNIFFNNKNKTICFQYGPM